MKVHEDRDERSLPVGGLQRDQLILDRLTSGLHFGADFLFDQRPELAVVDLHAGRGELRLQALRDLFARHVNEWREMGEGDGLAAVLARRHLGDDLGCDGAGSREAAGRIDMRSRDAGAVLQHVVEIDQTAVVHVLGEVVRVVEVNDAFFVRLDDILRKKVAVGVIAAPFAGHIITLDREHRRVLVAVFLTDLLVVALDDARDFLVDVAHLAHLIVLVPVGDVETGHLGPA